MPWLPLMSVLLRVKYSTIGNRDMVDKCVKLWSQREGEFCVFSASRGSSHLCRPSTDEADKRVAPRNDSTM